MADFNAVPNTSVGANTSGDGKTIKIVESEVNSYVEGLNNYITTIDGYLDTIDNAITSVPESEWKTSGGSSNARATYYEKYKEFRPNLKNIFVKAIENIGKYAKESLKVTDEAFAAMTEDARKSLSDLVK